MNTLIFKIRLALFGLAVVASAQVTNLKVESVTPQQAVVSYDAPDTAACTLAVTDNSGLGVTVWDVTSSKFANSNLDTSRASTTTWNSGLHRNVVLGSRTTQTGSDGKLYSRSLQANAAHTLTVTCTGGSASINFSTLNIPVGNTAPDPEDYSANGFGNVAWPTIDWSTTSRVYLDHKTGVALMRMTNPTDVTMVTTSQAPVAAYDPSSTWTNTSNILIGSGTSFATSSGTNPITVYLNASALSPNSQGGAAPSSNWVGYTPVGFRLRVHGNGNGSSITLNTCMTFDGGSTCGGSTQSMTLPASTGDVCWPSCASDISTASPYGDWATTAYPQHSLVVPASFTVSTSGTAVTSASSIAENALGTGWFPTNLPTTARLLIGSTQYGISSINSPQSVTLASSAGTQASATATVLNSGFKIWAASGTANITVSYDILFTARPETLIQDGASNQCSSLTATYSVNQAGSTVTPYSAYLCMYYFTGIGYGMYLHRPDTGETWPVGMAFNGYGNGFGSAAFPTFGTMPWDASDAKTFYGGSFEQDTSVPIIGQWKYRGDGRRFTMGPLPDSTFYGPLTTQGATGTSCSGGEQLWGNMCVSVKIPSTINSQVSALSVPYQNGAFGASPKFLGVVGSSIVVSYSLSQDAFALFAYIDTSSGTVTGVSDTMWSRTGTRWGAMHTAAGWTLANRYHLMAINPPGSRNNTGPFEGPYSTGVIKKCTTVNTGTGGCTTWNSSSALTSSDFYNCPAAACGTTVANSILLKLNGMACNPNANANEKAHYVCLKDPGNQGMPDEIRVGDYIGDPASNPGAPDAFSEAMQVLAITKNSDTDVDIWVQRFLIMADNQCTGGCYTHANQWVLNMFPSGLKTGATTGYWWFDSTNASASALFEYPAPGSHFDTGTAPTGYSYVAPSSLKYNVPANTTGVGTGLMNAGGGGFGSWSNLTYGTDYPGSPQVEFYPSLRQVNAPSTEKVWFADMRSMLGPNSGSHGQGYGTAVGAITANTATTGTSGVYKLTMTGFTSNPKLINDEAWAGYWMLRDTSPTISAASPYTFCRALAVNQCISGSSIGDIYVSHPSLLAPGGSCYTNEMGVTLPCVVPGSPVVNWATQQASDMLSTYGNYYRNLTQQFSQVSRRFVFWNWRVLPAGTWGTVPVAWLDGMFPAQMLVRIPSWPGYDTVRRDAYKMVQIPLGLATAQAEIRFGYEENGAITNWNCMKRQESCVSKSSPSATNLFNWLTTDGHSGTTCTSGCTITIPAISGRVLWWQAYTSPDGTTWTAVGTPQPLTP